LKSIKKSFHNALEKAQIEEFRFHDLRHTFSSYLAMGGIEENTRAVFSGYSKSTIMCSYTHTNWELKIAAVEIIGNLCG